MSKKQRQVYFNGKMVPESEAKVSIYDSALMFGDMVFEMTRSFNGEHFKLREHIERLYAGLKYLQIPIDMTMGEMEEACHEVTRVNDPLFAKDDEHRLMIDVSRGLLGLYESEVEGHKGTNVIIADFPLRWTVQSFAHLYSEGIETVVPSQRTIPAELIEPKVKNRSRIQYLMANIQVSQHKGRNVWALLLDPDGFVAEGSGANIFIVKDNVLYTPEPRNILRGISRAYVFELAEQLDIPCIEKNFEVYDVMEADEAFFTSTPFCMVPIVKVNNMDIGTAKPGPMFDKIITAWSENVGVDIIGQIKHFEKPVDSNAANPYEFKK